MMNKILLLTGLAPEVVKLVRELVVAIRGGKVDEVKLIALEAAERQALYLSGKKRF